MSKKQKKPVKPRARLPKGLRDIYGPEVRAMQAMIEKVRGVYELYGFEPLITPALEYTDALGKFLPDVDRPNAGVFSLLDEDGQWMSLRYDLTAPLARYVAQNFDALPKPFRRYQTGQVWRNEKPGPGRFRQFEQFDADTVGAPPGAADAEMCMMMADCMEALGIARGDYVIRINNRKLLDALLEAINVDTAPDNPRRLTVLRALDKLDRLGAGGVRALLGKGRKDESGDFTRGAELDEGATDTAMAFVSAAADTHDATLDGLERLVSGSQNGAAGIAELRQMSDLFEAAGYGPDRIVFDPSIVRGLDYYTGPVFEAELTFEAKNEDGEITRFGSVGGGGRYDGLVARFRGQPVPATGISLGLSRLYAALAALGKLESAAMAAPVIVLVMDKDQMAGYQAMARELREAGIRAEVYMGGSGMRAQMKYADKRGAPAVVIEGGDERERGEVTIKDLVLGAQKSKEITDNEEWRSGQAAQISVKRGDLVAQIKTILDRHQ
jgi:histidyl-tRNA synthetase